ncbi:P-loop containing nucleoside triphosphate hydrolase protein [Cunninghamella echinulata]|nr:P-loop containing nucleoside triphosphate hydrolase protein [Cunninghamella echinulata]
MSPPKIVTGSLLYSPYKSLLFNNIQRRGIANIPTPDPSNSVTNNSFGGVISTIAEKLGVGELAAGGLQLAAIGGFVAGARYFGGYIFEFFKKKIIVSADFDSRDESYSWILNWLSDHPYTQNATQFSISTTISRVGQNVTGEDLGTNLSPVYFLPAPGIHIFTYKNRLLWLSRERPQNANALSNGRAILERIQISTFGRSRDILESLVFEAQKKFIERDQSRTVVFAADQYGAWRRTRSRPKRPLGTIVIPQHIKNSLLDDANDFLKSEQWYSNLGIPYRLGVLFYGTPGSGKTSLVYSLAGELGLNIYVVNLSNKGLTDDTLSELVCETPSRCILLMEDIDSAFIQRDKGENTTGNNITFSGLLNSIDGVAAQEGRILFMTTNHIEKLDPALIRPGRIDIKIHFGNASKEQASELFTKFFSYLQDDYLHNLAKQFSSKIPNHQFSMAHLQGYLMTHKRTPEEAVQKVDEWVNKHMQNNGASSTTTTETFTEFTDFNGIESLDAADDNDTDGDENKNLITS